MPNTGRFHGSNSGSVLPTAIHGDGGDSNKNTKTSFSTPHLLDIENGTSMVVPKQRFLHSARYQELDDDCVVVVSAKTDNPFAMSDTGFLDQRGRSVLDQLNGKDICGFKCNSEVRIFGGAWRGTLKRILLWSMDKVNALRISRILQFFIPFQTGYEAYLLAQRIEALDSGRKKDIECVMKVTFQNRNVSRLLVQQVGTRHDLFPASVYANRVELCIRCVGSDTHCRHYRLSRHLKLPRYP